MKPVLLIALCSLSMGLFASETGTGTPTSNSVSGLIANSDSVSRYTFSDFFDALDLPTVLGAGVTPNGIESATFNSSMRLAGRRHKG